ncbi:MAG: UDP-2,3-diacylglucosamine diphosphatase [Ignavibacteria bacterium]
MEAKRFYFFSDVHLGLNSKEIEKQKEARLVKFLDLISKDAEKVFILGDLFDCWIEYRKVVPKGYYRLLAKLNEMGESGIEIVFLSGNHDFWLNTYLRDDVGLKIHNEPISLQIDDKKFYLTHGDGLSKNDLGYRIIKKILRNKFNQFLYSLIHPDIGISIAQRSSRKSRDYTSEKEFGSADGLKEFARRKISEGYDYVIMGHVHKPQLERITDSQNKREGYFATLGDWINHFSYGEYADGKFIIKSMKENF